MLYKINESSNTQKLYFLSKNNMDNKTLSPRIPDNYFTKNNYEDNKTKRVCFAPSIDKALMGLSMRVQGMILYVHVPIDNNLNIKNPTIKEVPDCKITGETWVLNNVKLKCIGKIEVINDAGEDGLKFTYGDKTAELYKWKWKWLEKEELVKESYVINDKDIYINFDKWKREKGKNILFITGLSGSGKTTLGEQLERENKAYLLEVDGIEFNYDSTKRGIIDKLKSNDKKYEKIANSKIKDVEKLGITKEEYREILHNSLKNAINIMKEDYNNLYIVEGIQIFQWLPSSYFKSKPMIIKGTSMTNSIIQRFKRNGNGKIDWVEELKNEFPQLVKWYIDDTKQLHKFKKDVLKESGSKEILFPKSEIQSLVNRLNHDKFIYTTRVSAEYGKYHVGEIYTSNLGYTVKVVSVNKFTDINKHPFLKELNKNQIKELSNYDKFELIKLKGIDNINESALLIQESLNSKRKNVYKYSDKFKDAKDVADSLSDKELLYLCNGEFKDSPNVIFRKVYRNNNKNLGFVELKWRKGYDYVGIALAVNPKYRGEGLAETMVTDAIEEISKNKDIKKIIWRADKDNKASNNLAKKFNFKPWPNNKEYNQNEYSLSIIKESEQLVPYNNHIFGKKDLYENIGQFAQGDDFTMDMVDPQSEVNRGSLFITRIQPDNFIKESYVFSEDDIILNFDKWGKVTNLLLVTGLSGSGKTTLMNSLVEKYKCQIIHFDEFIMEIKKPGRVDSHNLIKEYITNNPNIKINGWDGDESILACRDFYFWLDKELQKEKYKNKLYVLEGFQIYDFFDGTEFKNKPIIIKGTSVLLSWKRRASRMWKNENDPKKKFKYFISNLGILFSDKYFKGQQKIDKFVNVIKSESIKESAGGLNRHRGRSYYNKSELMDNDVDSEVSDDDKNNSDDNNSTEDTEELLGKYDDDPYAVESGALINHHRKHDYNNSEIRKDNGYIVQSQQDKEREEKEKTMIYGSLEDYDTDTIQEMDLYDDIANLDILSEFTHSDKFSDVKAVIKSLSDEERKQLAPNGFKDTPSCVYKKVYKNGNDKMGFIYIDVFPDNNETEAFIGMAVSPKYRGTHLPKTMIDDTIEFLSNKNKKIKTLVWAADKDNIASNRTAINLGFRKTNSYGIYNEYQYTLKNKVNESYIEEASVERKFKCPFCDTRDTKPNLVSHVDDEHEEMIPHGFTAARTVYNYINKTDGGHCIYCKGETEWDESRWKYKRICIKKVCKQQASKIADNNMKKIYGKTAKEMLEDPNHQNKMLAGRRISGEYNFKGQMKSYVGKNELKLLEFYDKVLNVGAEEVQTPGPVVEYTYKGKKHQWITDLYYVTANLAHDAKDGGDNPNNREMKEYREKQVAKEKAIAEQGKYNYVRVTNNEFDQLFEVLSELKAMMMDDDIEKKTICKINEYMAIASINPVIGSGACIVNYGINGMYAGQAFTKDKFMSAIYTVNPETNKVEKKSAKDMVDRYDFEMYMNDDIKDSKNIITQIESAIEEGLEVSHDYFYKLITGKDLLDESQLSNDTRFTKVLDYYSYMNEVHEVIRESLLHKYKMVLFGRELALESNLSNPNSIFKIQEDADGMYVLNSVNNHRSRYYDSVEEIPSEIYNILK